LATPAGALAKARRDHYTSQMSGKRLENAKAPAPADMRRERLGRELRQNLARRKQVMRQRNQAVERSTPIKAEPSAEISGS
jgi:hypothetical protein